MENRHHYRSCNAGYVGRYRIFYFDLNSNFSSSQIMLINRILYSCASSSLPLLVFLDGLCHCRSIMIDLRCEYFSMLFPSVSVVLVLSVQLWIVALCTDVYMPVYLDVSSRISCFYSTLLVHWFHKCPCSSLLMCRYCRTPWLLLFLPSAASGVIHIRVLFNGSSPLFFWLGIEFASIVWAVSVPISVPLV